MRISRPVTFAAFVAVLAFSANAFALELSPRQVRVGPDLSVSAAQKVTQILFKMDAASNEPIVLLIGVRSGYAPAAMMVVDAIRSLQSKVHAVIQSEAIGAGAVVALFCHKRYAFPSASILFKPLKYASKSVMKDKAPLPPGATRSYMDRIMEAVSKKLSIKRKALDAKIEKGWYMTASQAKKAGVIDKVVDKVTWVNLVKETVEIKRTSTVKEKRTFPKGK